MPNNLIGMVLEAAGVFLLGLVGGTLAVVVAELMHRRRQRRREW